MVVGPRVESWTDNRDQDWRGSAVEAQDQLRVSSRLVLTGRRVEAERQQALGLRDVDSAGVALAHWPTCIRYSKRMAMEVVAAIVVAAEEVDDVTRMQLTSTSVIESRSPILVVAEVVVTLVLLAAAILKLSRRQVGAQPP